MVSSCWQEDDPGDEPFEIADEAARHAGRNVDHVPRREGNGAIFHLEFAMPAGDQVDLVLCVRRLVVLDG
ncbi:MAG: hypothetical protein JWP15_2504 [Alphaproteobacteria bacterium]|nr:hypothetical protein [Alphaproteobacteria bacterium]